MGNKLRILIAEDHVSVREGFRFIIESQADMEVIGEAGDGRAAIEMARKLNPDIVLMDISMPKLNGMKAAATLKRVAPEIKILTLTRHTDTAFLQELLQSGVSGYVLKQSASEEILRALRAIGKGGSYLDPAITGKVFDDYVDKHSRLRGDTTGTPLTERESEVLRHISLGYSNAEIADKLDISVKTVESHKANCLKKLAMRSRKDIIRYAILQGWMQDS
ncbi:MAG: response regulator transcription factor [Pyrinomonadaceae bacterium]|nr:response regulator transcription factor [Pyrinomonadaceae bacterium]